MLPPERTMTVRLQELSDSWGAIANFLGAEPDDLRNESDRVRVAPARFDRFLVTPSETLAEYARRCGVTMERYFPAEHLALVTDLSNGAPAGDWDLYCTQAERWVDEGLREYGARIAY